jgi:hypothetical protein
MREIQPMPETVTKEMVLELLEQIQRETKEFRAEMASLKTEVRAINQEMALSLQTLLAKEQPDSDE